MIKKFFSFAWNVLNNEKGFFQALIPLVGAGLSAYAASQQPSTQQKSMQYTQPQLTPQQQAMQNMLYYGAMSNLYQQPSGYQDLLSQYIYGGAPGGVQAGMGQTTGGLPGAEGIIEGYQQQKAQAAETETRLGELKGDLTLETAKPLMELVRELNELSPVEKAKRKKELVSQTKETSQQLQDLTGKSKAVADKVAMQIANGGGVFSPFAYSKVNEAPEGWKGFSDAPGQEGYTHAYIKTNVVPSDLGYGGSMYEGAYRDLRHASSDVDMTRLFTQHAISRGESYEDIQNLHPYAELPQKTWDAVQQEMEIAPTGEVPVTPEGTPTTPEGTPTTPAGGILEQIMDPSYIGEQFGLAKERGMEEIGSWYEQAQREFEQRGIGQYGGYMGSPVERDIGGILGKRGEMESTLGRELSTAQIGMERQNWFDVLNALTGLQTLQSNLQTAQTSPWMGAAQALSTAPYGQTTTTPYQGVGMIPAAVSGALTGAGLYQNLSNWGGQGGQPATSYASTNIPATYGGSPSGYEGSMYGYGY